MIYSCNKGLLASAMKNVHFSPSKTPVDTRYSLTIVKKFTKYPQSLIWCTNSTCFILVVGLVLDGELVRNIPKLARCTEIHRDTQA